MVSEIIKPGDKIDINFVHQSNGKTYKSSVFDFLEGNFLEIAMPTEGGKMVLFNLGVECQLYFYTSKGMYTCEAIVAKRYKRDNFFLLAMKMKTGLKRYQRREFFRVECLIDFNYYKISDEVAKLEEPEEFFSVLMNPIYKQQKKLARTRDLSGGGIRFTAEEPLEIGSKILIVIRLVNDKMDQVFYLVSDIISCDIVETTNDRWIVRAKWKLKNPKEQEKIVRFVFEEDRMKRKKEIR